MKIWRGIAVLYRVCGVEKPIRKGIGVAKKAETFTNQLQIKDVIRKVQQELIESQKEREESGILPLFEVDSLELEIHFIVRQQSEGRAGLSFAVVDAEAEHNYSREQVQKMTLRLKRAETDSYDFSPPFRRPFAL